MADDDEIDLLLAKLGEEIDARPDTMPARAVTSSDTPHDQPVPPPAAARLATAHSQLAPTTLPHVAGLAYGRTALRCTRCDFRVLCFRDRRWLAGIDYMHLRNWMPDAAKVQEELQRENEMDAYACQCLLATVERFGAPPVPQWRSMVGFVRFTLPGRERARVPTQPALAFGLPAQLALPLGLPTPPARRPKAGVRRPAGRPERSCLTLYAPDLFYENQYVSAAQVPTPAHSTRAKSEPPPPRITESPTVDTHWNDFHGGHWPEELRWRDERTGPGEGPSTSAALARAPPRVPMDLR
ncbi:retinal maintenance-domain-containing protein [Pavlovales sp. CCMP2436]|nr:retinal maintenance-domain-containing protein [Pavlovales sp. CCMP2436]